MNMDFDRYLFSAVKSGRLEKKHALSLIKKLTDAASVNPPQEKLFLKSEWVERSLSKSHSAREDYAEHIVIVCGVSAAELDTLQRKLPNTRLLALTEESTHLSASYIGYAAQLLSYLHAILSEPFNGQKRIQLAFIGNAMAASLVSLLESAAQENPQISAQSLSFEAAVEPSEVANCLLQELTRSEVQIRFDLGVREVIRQSPCIAETAVAEMAWQKGGKYLLCGTPSQILSLAQDIAAYDNTEVIAICDGVDNQDSLNPGAGTIEIHYVNMMDSDGFQSLLDNLQLNQSGLNGVIYCRGIPEDQSLPNKAEAALRKFLSPALSGLVLLDKATSSLGLDFFLLAALPELADAGSCRSNYAMFMQLLNAYAIERQSRVALNQSNGFTCSLTSPVAMSSHLERLFRLTLSLKQEVLTGFVPANAADNETPDDSASLIVTPMSGGNIKAMVLSTAARFLDVNPEEIDTEEVFSRLGLDSINLIKFGNALGQSLATELSPVVFFDYPTIDALSEYLQSQSLSATSLSENGKNAEQTEVEIEKSKSRKHASKTQENVADRRIKIRGDEDRMLSDHCVDAGKVDAGKAIGERGDEVAIVGLSCQFPESEDAQMYWDNLLNQRNCISEISSARWDWESCYGDPIHEVNKTNIRHAGLIDGVDAFDAKFFGISPKEAEYMDPQQRLLLMHAWKTIEDAGHDPKSLSNSKTSVFIGVCDSGYGGLMAEAGVPIEAYSATGLAKSVAANRISYYFNFRGPSEPVDAGCASALVALHRAAETIRSGECDMAIAGAVNLIIAKETHIALSKAGLLSQNGRCHSFSDKANGFVRGEGIGLLMLKRLKDAERDGDHIYGLIKGSAINHSGYGNSLTSPNSIAQSQVLIAAYQRAGIDPASINYIEAHATGTDLGDPIEVQGLKSAFSHFNVSNDQQCRLGSSKSNVGHLEVASGMASLIKVLLQLKHKTLVKSLHSENLNPYLALNNSPFSVIQKNQPWSCDKDRSGRVTPRRAGISAFGFSGINTHMVVEEYLSIPANVSDLHGEKNHGLMIVLSAKSNQSLQQQLEDLLNRFKSYKGLDNSTPKLAELAYTLQVGRAPMQERMAFVVRSYDDLVNRLECALSDKGVAGIHRGNTKLAKGSLDILAAEAGMQDIVKAWFQRGEIDKLLSLWVKGMNIHWPGLYSNNHSMQRVSLPTYPFAKDFYWVPGLTAPSLYSGDKELTGAITVGQKTELDYRLDTAVQGDIQPQLGDIWCEVLGIDSVAAEDRFFDVGGHSIFVAQVLARIETQFGVSLSMRLMFERPSLAELAKIVEGHLEDEGARVKPIVALRRYRDIPLSLAQQAYWFLYKLEGSSSTYNIPMFLSIKGELDIPALNRALNHMLERHDSLRCCLRDSDSGPVQDVKEFTSFQLALVEASEQSIDALLDAEVGRSFNLTEDIPYRTKLFQLAAQADQDGEESEAILSIVFHHASMDGWSFGNYLGELTALYEAFSSDQANPLPALAIQYSDYAIWQQDNIKGERYEAQVNYWQQTLSGLAPMLNLPSDHIRPPQQSYRGESCRIAIPSALSKQLNAFAKSEGVTLFNVLMSGLALLLARYARTDDIPIGTAVANRPRQELENLIGCFANAVVVRCQVDGATTFKQLVHKTTEISLSAFEHSDVPFDGVVEAVQPERSLGVPPIFQIMFRLHNQDMGWDTQWQGLDIAAVDYSKPVAELDLNISLRETEAGIVGDFTFAKDLFNRETIERFIRHYQQILQSALDHAEQKVAGLPMLSEQERDQIIAWNATQIDYPQDECIHALFEQSAARLPNKEAYVCGDSRFTYQQLNEKANQLAHWLRSQGVGPEDRIGLSVGRTHWMGIGALAILKSGGTYVPLDPHYPADRLGHMLDVAKPKLILAEEALCQLVPSSESYAVIALDNNDIPWSELPINNPEAIVGAEHSAYILFTSGSTGKPKGILVAHKGWRNMALAHKERGLSDENNNILQFASVSFAVSLWGAFMAWAAGGKLCQVTDEQALPGDILYDYLHTEQITTVTWPVSLLSVLPVERIPECLHTVISSAEPCNDAVVERWTKSGRRFLNIYGNSEVSMGSSLYEYHRVGQKLSIGLPLPNTQMYLLDENLQLVPPGVVAEIFTGGVGLAKCYVDQTEKTAAQFIADPYSENSNARLYRTGDLGRYLPNGEIEFIGREDFQVSVRGFRVELNEIEGVLREHQGVEDLAVVARPDATGIDRLVCFYVLNDDAAECDAADLRQLVANKLPNYMVPSLFIKLDAMPLTPNRKVDRLSLKVPSVNEIKGLGYVAPKTASEKQLTEIWSSVLALENIGMRDNFFELGGHSLLAMQLVAKVEEAFSRKIPVSVLFDSPTIAELAKVIDSQQEVDESPVLHMKKETSLAPIILIPGVGGGVLNFYDFAKALNEHREVIALKSNYAYQQGHKSVEEVARFNIELLTKLTALDDVILVGHSFGGWVAYEMAAQLAQANIEVGSLILLDSLSPYLTNQQIEKISFESFVLRAVINLLGGDIEEKELLAVPKDWDLLKHQVTKFMADQAGASVSSAQVSELVDLVRLQLGSRYQPQSNDLPCKSLAIMAADGFGCHAEGLFTTALGWMDIIDGELSCDKSGGDHFSMLHGENIVGLVERIDHWCSAVESSDYSDNDSKNSGVQILRSPEDTEQQGYYEKKSATNLWGKENAFVMDLCARAQELDYLGHVSHAVYLSWLGMVTWAHNRELGLDWQRYEEKNSAMAILKHNAEYLLPVREGEDIRIATWCSEYDERFRLQRTYQAIRLSDNKTVFKCTTDYACIGIKNGRPKRMPKEFLDAYASYFSFLSEKHIKTVC